MHSSEHVIGRTPQAVAPMTGRLWSQESYIAAYQFAARAHNGQKVPGTDLPYIVHVTLVTMEIMTALANKNSLDADLAVQCALLHDTIEDTPVTYDLVKDVFGGAVADGVLALTKDKAIVSDVADKKERKQTMMRDSLRRIREQPREFSVMGRQHRGAAAAGNGFEQPRRLAGETRQRIGIKDE